MSGILYIVATPIGNLDDITQRAARILAEVDRIVCEDTRHTAKLLAHLNISKPLVSLHEHNERQRTPELVRLLIAGARLALVSDAGTPLISDPGYRLVREAIAAGASVVPIPGPSAVTAALSASGLGTDAFYFGGFLPRKRAQRRKQLQQLQSLPATLVFFEAPHRILAALEDIAEIFGQRPLVLARELTKVHEEFLRGSARQLYEQLQARAAIKGEFTILIAAQEPPAETSPEALSEAVNRLERQGISRMQAIKEEARRRGVSKRELYRQLHEPPD